MLLIIQSFSVTWIQEILQLLNQRKEQLVNQVALQMDQLQVDRRMDQLMDQQQETQF